MVTLLYYQVPSARQIVLCIVVALVEQESSLNNTLGGCRRIKATKNRQCLEIAYLKWVSDYFKK